MKRIVNFTLIELLVVVSIIGILVSILLPSLSSARERAKLTVCLSNNRQMNIMAQTFANSNDFVLPSQTWYAQNIRGTYWMFQINDDWEWGSFADVTGTAFECTTFKTSKKVLLSPGVSEHAQKGVGGIGYNRYIGGDVDSRYGRDVHNVTFSITQVANPSETALFADTKNSAKGSGGPGWQIQALSWANGDVENYVQRHQVGKGINGWRMPVSWVDASAKILRSVDYHSKEREYTLINAVR